MQLINKTGSFEISRRNFLLVSAAGALASLTSRHAEARVMEGKSDESGFKFVKELKDCFCRAVSPDSKKLCVFYSPNQNGKFTLKSIGGKRSESSEVPNGYILTIVELESWRELFSFPISGVPGIFSFLGDSEKVYGETTSTSLPLSHGMVFVDLRTNKKEERQELHDPKTTAYYSAVKDNKLIGFKPGRGLVEVEWPSLNEAVRTQKQTEDISALISLTADRSRLIHLAGQSLICRKVDDLSILWSRQIDADIDMKATMKWRNSEHAPHLASADYSISADGSIVALAPRGFYRFYIEILNGIDGSPIARRHIDHRDGILLSPHRNMLLRKEIVDDQDGLKPTLRIYEIPSGHELGTVVHGRVPYNKRLNAGIIAQFTPNGRYLITSAAGTTKIWQVP